MNSSTEPTQNQDSFEESPFSPNLLGGMFGLMDVVVFSLVGYVLFEDPIAGGLAGLSVGTGVFLFLPLFIASAELDDGLAGAESDANRHPFRSFHRLAAGFALSAGGIAYLGYFFVDESFVPSVPIGLLVAAVVYIALSFILPNADL